MSVLRDWKLTIDADMVLRGQGADPAAIRAHSPALVAVAEKAIAEGLPLLAPAVLHRALAVESYEHERLLLAGGGTLSGPLIARHLAGCEQVLAILCTVGPALEEWAARIMAGDPIYGFALDGVGSAAAEVLATVACRRLEGQAAAEGLHAGMPLNPGLIGWPVEQGQREVFSLLDGSEVGISLTGGYMMLPRKSVSLVLGLSRQAVALERSCDYCTLRASCRHRHEGT